MLRNAIIRCIENLKTHAIAQRLKFFDLTLEVREIPASDQSGNIFHQKNGWLDLSNSAHELGQHISLVSACPLIPGNGKGLTRRSAC